MCDLVKRLDIKAGVMEMGEKIAFGSDSALMREAERTLDAMQAREERIKAAIRMAFGKRPIGVDGVITVPVEAYNRIVEELNA